MKALHVSQAVFLAFSIELLQTSQLSDRKPAFLFPICIPKRRIAFVDINGLPITGNTHASALIYVGIMSALLSRISVNSVLSEVKLGNSNTE